MANSLTSDSWYRVANLRPDLVPHARLQRHRYRGKLWYVLQDQASARAHRLTPTACLLVNLMNGRRSLTEIWALAGKGVKEDVPTQDELIQLVGQLHASDLIRCDVTPDTEEVFERYRQHRRRKWQSSLFNPMSIKLPLLDPDRFLTRWLPFLRVAFNPFMVLVWLAVVIPALVLASSHWSELTNNLSDRVLGESNLVLLWLIFPLVKILHELGHAATVKVAGREVHEVGLMLLVLTPVPYVDASDSSALRSKWTRAVIGAAGMLVEIFIAALALYVWLSVEEGLVRAMAFNVMVIAGVSTLLFNANPLLRYDGYYILSDVIEIPNLGQRANRYLGYLVERYLFNMKNVEPDLATPGEKVWFVFYALTSFVYRQMVTFGIALFVATQYYFVGILIALWGLVTGIGLPLAKGVIYLMSGTRLGRHRLRARLMVTGFVAFLGVVLFVIPAPHSTIAEGVLWLPKGAEVTAQTGGFVHAVLQPPASMVKAGDALFDLRNTQLMHKLEYQKARVDELTASYAAQFFEHRLDAAVTREALIKERAELARIEQEIAQLGISAASTGIFIAPKAADLPGRYVKRGEVLGWVAPLARPVVRVAVSQAAVDDVRSRTRAVEVRLPQSINQSFAANVVREVPAASNTLPSPVMGVSGGGNIALDPNDREGKRALERLFQFDVLLPEQAPRSGFGSRVYVRFEHSPMPLGLRWLRDLRLLFLSHFQI